MEKREMLERLRELQSVSLRLEELLHALRAGSPLPVDQKREMEGLASRQGAIVEWFVALSQDGEACARYQEASRSFQKHLEALHSAQDVEQLALLRGEVSTAVDAWVASLEAVIRGVMLQTG